MNPRVYGCDPSLTSFGISDGQRHEIIKTTPDNTLTQSLDLIRRVDVLTDGVVGFIGLEDDLYAQSPILVVIEAPMASATHAHHLLEVGFLMSGLYRALYPACEIIEVSPSSLKKFFAGNGGAGKRHSDSPKKPHYEPCMVCAGKDKWGVTFPKDPGQDLLHAYALQRYGEAVVNGTLTHTPSQRRGHNHKPKGKRVKK